MDEQELQAELHRYRDNFYNQLVEDAKETRRKAEANEKAIIKISTIGAVLLFIFNILPTAIKILEVVKK